MFFCSTENICPSFVINLYVSLLFSITDDYANLEQRRLAATEAQCMRIINSIEDVVCVSGRYHSISEKSKHIRDLIHNQRQRPY